MHQDLIQIVFRSLKLLPYDNVDNLAPAGAIVSCVKDISKWLLLQLDSGNMQMANKLFHGLLYNVQEI